MHDAGNCRAVLRAHHQHVASVAIGHHLLLQVLRGVLAAEVRFERSAQSRTLLPQPVAQRLELGTRIVHDLAGRIDLAADLRDLTLERRDRFDDAREQRERCPRAADAGGARLDRREKCRERNQRQRLERTAFDGQRRQDLVEVGWRAQRDLALRGEKTHRFGGRRQRRADVVCVELRPQTRETVRPGRRLREPGDGLDDTVEFEGLEGAWVHVAGREAACERNLPI